MGLFITYFGGFCLFLLTSSVTAVEISGKGGIKHSSSSVWPVFQPNAVGPFVSLGLSAFPEDLEISEYCAELLRIFGHRCTTLVNCLVSSARPVKVCQNCYVPYNAFQEIYKNISHNETGPGNMTCEDTLMRADRLMLLFSLYSNLDDIWTSAECTNCLTNQMSLSNDTLYFTDKLNQTLSCFNKYMQGNHSELCKACKPMYKVLKELYSNMAKNNTLCIDLEDAMNVTRHLWSGNFSCSFPREETIPVIAVSSFMLFLPIIFYLSNFLHSEQKKRKLIQPKRAKSSNSLMNIQDKYS